ncbi:Acetyltransferase (GNAT) family protein [Gimesia panareensis]|uniref:Acetyltransferase (GNAT) family protein n=1 Tax=Gimesia panareensis TaxID=2527978 RepID=A0A518FJ68_9PLAN|nr:N-acetyltransferase [Gimesia panareensis]QDV16353.1 Acetyltransferase (GNAT) family protein [Gimesia panareensis]
MDIRQTTAADFIKVKAVHQEAFGPEEGPVIVSLLDELLPDPTAAPILSLLAEDGPRVLGHVLFTNVVIQGAEPVAARILAPLAVLPSAQKQGVGRQLVEAGLKQLRDAGGELVFVLGDPAYYTRFGFQPAGARGLKAPHPIPVEHAEAWMVQELCSGVLGRVMGEVEASQVLNRREYWIG